MVIAQEKEHGNVEKGERKERKKFIETKEVRKQVKKATSLCGISSNR